MLKARGGFTLIEVSLALAVGLALLAGTIVGFNQVQRSAKFSQAKTMVGTIQTNIGMEKFRTGSPPSPDVLFANEDSASKPFYPDSQPGMLPDEPTSGYNGMLRFDSTASPVPLQAGDPTPQWDNPVFAPSAVGPTPGFTAPAGYRQPPGYGAGGWLYDPTTGAFRANLSNKQYPDQRPGAW